MLHEADLRELVEFDGQGSSVLSLYLNVDPRNRTTEKYKLALRSLFAKQADVDPDDKERVEQFIDLEYEHNARGLACFSCQKQGFWRAYPLNVPVEDAMTVSRRPLVRRLVGLLETYGNLGVVAVDRLGARFFSFHMGALEEARGTMGEEVKRHKQGGWASSRYQRHEDEAAMANLREVAELTGQYARQYQWRRLVLAGTESNIARFRQMLPADIRRLVVGTTPLEINAGVHDVREKAEAVAMKARNVYVQKLAGDLMVAAGKGEGAAIDLGPTLDALQSGRVHELLISKNYKPGEGEVRRCTACNYLSTENGASCPVCGGEQAPLTDAINTIARRAILQSALVTVLPIENPMEAAGHHIGAFLRF